MPIRPKHSLGETRPVATRQFTDREEFIQAFRNALQREKPKEQCVLMYFGVGGIGKTSLRKELVRLLEVGKTDTTWAVLDFETPSFREQETALFALRKFLKDKYKIPFPTFDLAYALFWKKTRPQIPMNKETFPLLEGEGIIADMMRIIGGFSGVPVIGLIPIFSKLVAKGQKFIKEWWRKRGLKELDKLPQLDPKGIAERLPMYWAGDLRDYLEAKNSSAVIFIDSYEALWEGARSEAKVFKQDEWVRELVSQLPQVLWVICGRERLRWAEYDANWAKYLKQHLVGGLSEVDARRFLGSCGINNETVQKVIVEGSKGVPYYLDLAVDTYFEIKYRANREPVGADFARTTKDVLIRFLRNLDRSEIETLKVLSVTRFWDYRLFEELISEFKTGYPVTAYAELCRFSFINKGEIAETWKMHQLMQENLKANLDPNIAKSIHRFLFNHYNNELKEIDIKNITHKHKNALTEGFYHGKFYLAELEFFNWFTKIADVFRQAAQWKMLVPLYEEITEILGKKVGAEHLDIAAALDKLALLYHEQGKYPETESYYKRALAIKEKALGQNHPEVAQSFNSLADLYRDMGKYNEAEPIYQKALAIRKRVFGPSHLSVAESLNSLAVLFWNQGKYGDAELYFKQALEIREKSFGPEHPDVAETLNNLGVLYWKQGRYNEAEPLYIRALAIKEKVLGPDHWDVAETANNLGLLYWNMGKSAEAESLYQRALAIMEKKLGTEHPQMAIYLNNLAVLYWKQGRLAEAEPLFKQTLKILEKALGPDHPNVAKAIGNLARLCTSQGKYGEAELLITRAIRASEKVLGPSHPDLARSLNTLGNLFREQGKSAEAESTYQRAIGILEKVHGPDHPDIANILEDRAKLYRKIAKDEAAKLLDDRVKQIRSKKRLPKINGNQIR